jgi:hypothetical protein
MREPDDAYSRVDAVNCAERAGSGAGAHDNFHVLPQGIDARRLDEAHESAVDHSLEKEARHRRRACWDGPT